MPRRKRIPPKPIPQDTVVIEHVDADTVDFDGEDFTDEDFDAEMEKQMVSEVAAKEEAAEKAICALNESDDVIAILKRSRSTNPVERKAALRTMCPCKVKREIDPFWVRIVEMCNDPDDAVRYQVLHSLCDGSPLNLEELVAETVRSFWNDPNEKVRRAARRAYNSWQRGDGINIL